MNLLCLLYMVVNKTVITLFVLYTLFSAHVLYTSVTSYRLNDAPRIFLKDPNAPERINAAISADHNMPFVARTLHNKVLVSWQVVTDAIYRSLDISFLFSLTSRSSLYDNPGKMQMLPFFELPFFFVAVIFFIKRWEKMKMYGIVVVSLLIFSLLVVGVMWPFIFPLKLILLMITIQLIIFLGNVGLVSEIVQWQKK